MLLLWGGGVAGISAALAAARNGAKTCIIEKETCLGGLATLGLVVIYLPLCDGVGNQVIGGIGEELMRNALKYGPGMIPPCWENGGDKDERKKKRFRSRYNAASFMISVEELLLEAGVSLIYDSRFCDIYKDNQYIKAVIIENKSGRIAFGCGAVIDATGDADVCDRAGEITYNSEKNIRTSWYFSYDNTKVKLHQLTDNMYNIKPDQLVYSGTNWKDVVRLNIDGRRMIMDHVNKVNEKAHNKIYPIIIPTISEFLMTRRLVGSFELDCSHEGQYFSDSVAMTGDWRKKGPVYYIPLSALAGVRNSNLITAGRCISTSNEMWDITRVIPTCAVTGEAAGTAAAVLIKDKNRSISDLNISRLQEMLISQGMIINRKSQK